MPRNLSSNVTSRKVANPEAILEVATKCRQQGEEYALQGNPSRAFAHFLMALNLQPQWKPELKSQLTTVLCIWGCKLEQKKRYRDLFHCYHQALELFPENEEVLNNLGAHLFRFGHVREAKCYFQRALLANPDFLPASCNLENMASLLVERWHFRMLNDNLRNEAYREAVAKKIRQGFKTVLDIGTGTGLLSLFAADSGALQVHACECSSTMVHIAQEVLKANKVDKITLINKMSSNLLIPQDIPSRVALVVTETMDSGLLGEHVLQTLSDAWKCLLLPPCPGLSSERGNRPSSFTSRQKSPPRQRYGLVIPLGASIWVAGIESSHLALGNSVASATIQKMGLDPSTPILVHRSEPYDSEDISKIPGDVKFLTEPQDVLYINFNDPEDINNCLLGLKSIDLKISCCEAGRLDALVAWFTLRLDEDIVLSSAPGHGSCWEQALFPLETPKDVQAGHDINVSVNCHAGQLKITINEITPETNVIFFKNSVSFLNDLPWIEALTSVAENLKGRKDLEVLDLSPFPFLGLLLLKNGTAKNLVCSVSIEADQKAVKSSAGETAHVSFVTSENLEEIEEEFDVIVTHPISRNGELDQSIILQLPTLRCLLNEGGIFLPSKITVMGQLINSEWLKKMSRVVDDSNVGGYRISEFINAYQVSQHLDLFLSTLDHTALSQPTILLEITPGDPSLVSEKLSDINITTVGEVNAIPYWYKVCMGNDMSVSTNHEASHINQAAILLEPGIEANAGQTLSISARHQQGFLHFSCLGE